MGEDEEEVEETTSEETETEETAPLPEPDPPETIEEIPAWAAQLEARINQSVTQALSSFQTTVTQSLVMLSKNSPPLPQAEVVQVVAPEPETPPEPETEAAILDTGSTQTDNPENEPPMAPARKPRGVNYRRI